MPVKPVSKDRAWGTRYDTLDLSPPVSPFATNLPTTNIAHAQTQSSNFSTDSQGATEEGTSAQKGRERLAWERQEKAGMAADGICAVSLVGGLV